MPIISAGILMYRYSDRELQVLLVHPGGPYWIKKDIGAWSVPKGEIEPGENLLEAAIRETAEETGIQTEGNFIELSPVRQKSGKLIHAWALKTEQGTNIIKSNLFEIEWPPKSGNMKSFPEIDKAAWFGIDEAKQKIVSGQIPFITELETLLNQ